MRFSPFRNNVIDYIDVPLVSEDGRSVIVRRPMIKFLIYVDDVLYKETDDNISASYTLNSLNCDLKC